MKKNRHKKEKGFTLVELLATIVVLAIVAGIGIYIALGKIKETKEKSYDITTNNIENVTDSYLKENSNRLFYIQKDGEEVEYQCITIQNLIDMDYFDNTITNSKYSDNSTVGLNDYVYIERNIKTKSIVKVVYLKENNEYEGKCDDAVKAIADIEFSSYPSLDTWATSKKITINYKLKNANDIKEYNKYSFAKSLNKSNLNNNGIYTKEKTQTINVSEENQTVYAGIIYNLDVSNLIEKDLKVTKIDRTGPTIKLGTFNDHPTGEVKIPLIVSDSGVGNIDINSIDKSKISIVVDGNNINFELKTVNEKEYDIIYNGIGLKGNTSITINDNCVKDKLGNGSTGTSFNPTIIYDSKPPVMTLSSNGDSTYTKTKSLNVTIKDDVTGIASGASLKYGWSTSSTTAPTSYTTVTPTYTAGTTSDVTFTINGSGITGDYYLWVVPTTIKDLAGNSLTTTLKSTNVFKYDNTAPTCSLTVNSSGITLTKNDNISVSAYGMGMSSTVSYNSKTSLGLAAGTAYGFVKDSAGNESTCKASKAITSTTKNTYNCNPHDCNGRSCNCRYIACGTYCSSPCYRPGESACCAYATSYCYVCGTCYDTCYDKCTSYDCGSGQTKLNDNYCY